jgi:hypothetical protein
MNKIINFFKNLFSYFKKEIVMEQPEPLIQKKRTRKKRENSKHTKVKRHLIENGSINKKIAKELYGAKRLPVIINRLRNEGYKIVSKKYSSKFITYEYLK